MKTINEIVTSDPHYDLEWLVDASKELTTLQETGLWPKHCPAFNRLRQDLTTAGFPHSQVMNIAIGWVQTEVVKKFSRFASPSLANG